MSEYARFCVIANTACKTLSDSERRKTAPASNRVHERQLVLLSIGVCLPPGMQENQHVTAPIST